MSDDRQLGFVQLPTSGEVAAGVALAEAFVRLARLIYDWITSDDTEAPVNACVAALAVMVDREPDARKRIVDECAKNPVLRVQMLDICGAYEKHWPAFGKLRKELEG
jgi:hypothetical protein